jgi:nucleoid-associated protein YgaU
MTMRRWATTTAVMAAVGWALLLLGPADGALTAALTSPQRTVDTAGPDALLVPVVWVLAAACWAWGAVGLALTALSVRTGLVGRASGALLHVVLPAGLRQVAAVAVGVSLATVPVMATAAPADPSTTSAPSVSASGSVQKTGPAPAAAPGWADVGTLPAPNPAPDPAPDPAVAQQTGAAPVPDWPTAPGADEHVVLRGDCLWDIATDWLAARSPGGVTPAATASAVHAWWQANAEVIGPDPDLLRPGQVLRAPDGP